MSWQIIRIARGKETVEDEGDRKKLTNRLKQLRAGVRKGASGRGGKKYPVRYELREKT